MTFDEFNKFTEEIVVEVQNMRDTKGKEYARSTDRFDNFNRLSARLQISRMKVWLVYFTKHMDAIESYIQEQRSFSSESIRGRFVDAITYLTLGAGMIQEECDGYTKNLQPVENKGNEVDITVQDHSVFFGYPLSEEAKSMLRGIWPKPYSGATKILHELYSDDYIDLEVPLDDPLQWVLTEKGLKLINYLDKAVNP